MNRLEILLQMEEFSQERHGQNQRGDSAKDGASDEVRPENRRVPHGYRRHGEIPGNNGVYGNGHGNDGDGHNVHGAFQTMPLLGIALPAQREQRVKFFAPAMSQIPGRGGIGNDGQKQEKRAAGKVSENGEKIPQQRRAEIRPDMAFTGVGNEQIEQPRPP